MTQINHCLLFQLRNTRLPDFSRQILLDFLSFSASFLRLAADQMFKYTRFCYINNYIHTPVHNGMGKNATSQWRVEQCSLISNSPSFVWALLFT